jgi:hypothetical protein
MMQMASSHDAKHALFCRCESREYEVDSLILNTGDPR